MRETNPMRASLAKEFTENHMQKLFYFCLKKTGSTAEAEDLTQDIALNILAALHKGVIPTNFSAWVWQIARNRYSVWAKAKHDRSLSVTASDIGDYEIEDDRKSILDEMIHRDELALLRRELAFIRSDYRNIVIAYYIDNKSVRDIASSESLSVCAVQQRLHRARIILKEGMDMAREYGVRSYKPEEITFTNSCSSFGDKGQPWSILSHGMYKNIFLEAYGNPSTSEELSLALGIALPYMEEELKYLTAETFLIKNGDKYETSFPIISKDTQEKIRQYNQGITQSVTHLFEKLVDDFTAACQAHGIAYYGQYQNYEDAKWTLLMRTFDSIAYEDGEQKEIRRTKRPDNGNWDIVGYEQTSAPDLPYVGLHGCMQENASRSAVDMGQFKFQHFGIQHKTPSYLNFDETWALKLVAEGKWAECDAHLLENLLNYGYIRKNGEEYEPAIVVFDGHNTDRYWQMFSDAEKKTVTASVAEIRKILDDATEFARQVTVADLPPLFKNDERLCTFACSNNKYDRKNVLAQALEDGWLTYDDNTAKAIGAYIYL